MYIIQQILYHTLILSLLLADFKSVASNQIIKTQVQNLRLHSFNKILLRTPEEITAIQRDSYRQVSVIVAFTNTVWSFNLNTNSLILLFGSNNTDVGGDRDGVYKEARFVQIVDLVQAREVMYILEIYCIRRALRIARYVETIAGDCTTPGDTGGRLTETRFGGISSGVLLSSTRLVVSDTIEGGALRAVDLLTNTTITLGRCHQCRTLFTNSQLTRLYTFDDGMKEIDINDGQIRLVGWKPMSNSTVDGNLNTSSYRSIRYAFMFEDSLVIAIDDLDDVLRLYDMNSGVVTSLCRVASLSHGTTPFEVPSNFTHCHLHDLNSVTMFPERGSLILGTKHELLDLQLSLKSKSCRQHIDCENFCTPGRVLDCTTLHVAPAVCDPDLKQCTHICESGSLNCSYGKQCVDMGRGSKLCRQECADSSDCLHNERCIHGACVKEVEPDVVTTDMNKRICVVGCKCLYMTSFAETTYGDAVSNCNNSGGSLFDISSEEEGSAVLELLSGAYSRYIWVDMEPEFIESLTPNSPFYETKYLRERHPSSALFYHVNQSLWYINHKSPAHPAAGSLCQSEGQRRVLGNSREAELSPMSTCEDNSRCREKLYPGCRVDLVCEEVGSEHCCYLSQLLEYDVIVEDLEDLSQLNFSVSHALNCTTVEGRAGTLNAMCTMGEWNISLCSTITLTSQKCVFGCSLPDSYRLMDSSSEGDVFFQGDIVLLACTGDVSAHQQPDILACTEHGWQPILSALQVNKCSKQSANRGLVNWIYDRESGNCYSIQQKPQLTYEEAVDFCTTLFSLIARVASQGLDNLITSHIQNVSSPVDKFWISGSFDSRAKFFKHQDGTFLRYIRLPPSSRPGSNDCLHVNGGIYWATHKCNISSPNTGTVCQRSDLQEPESVWSEWTVWSACATSYTRQRSRACLSETRSAGNCAGDKTYLQKCCQPPDISLNVSVTPEVRSVVAPGTKLYFSCNYGYRKQKPGNVMMECLSNGRWNNSPPTCYARPCKLEDIVTSSTVNSYISSHDSVLEYYTGFYVHRVCNHTGFILKGLDTSSRKIHCNDWGDWSEDYIHHCEERSCGRVPDIENAVWNRTVYLSTIKEERREKDLVYYLDQIIFNCLPDYHYRQSDEFTLTCQSDGTLYLLQPRCVEKMCDRETFDLPPHSSILSPLPVNIGQVVNLTCDRSYVVSGTSDHRLQLVQCIENNRWQLLDYRPCVVIGCQDPGQGHNIKSLTATQDMRIGEKIVYLCADGMIDYRNRRAVVKIECLPDLTWSAPPANCSEILCEDPGEAGFSTRKVSGYRLTDTVVYTCVDMYEVPGTLNISYTLTCKEDALWDRSVTSCVTAIPYYSLKLERIENNTVTVSFIQSANMHQFGVQYRLVAEGSHIRRMNRSNKIVSNEFTVVSRGVVYQTIALTPAHLYNLSLESSIKDQADGRVFKQLVTQQPIYIQSVEPQLLSGLNVNDTAPVFRDNQNVLITLPFVTSQDEVKAFALIVCDIITYLPKRYYDGKLVFNLSSYQQVVERYEKPKVWGCYQTMPPCAVTNYSSCKSVSPRSNGFIRYHEVKRLDYSVGVENCDGEKGYCNGELKPMSTFCVKLRAFSDDDYFDSPCSNAIKTPKKIPKNLMMVLLVPGFLGLIVAIAGEACRRKMKSASADHVNRARQFYRFDPIRKIEVCSEIFNPSVASFPVMKKYVMEAHDGGIVEKESTEKGLPAYRVLETGRLKVAASSWVNRNSPIGLRKVKTTPAKMLS